MGSPVSSAVADIFMEDLEEKAFSKYPDVPRVWHRFVDDILTVVKKDGAEKLLQHLNNQHPRIQFTMEQEKRMARCHSSTYVSLVGEMVC